MSLYNEHQAAIIKEILDDRTLPAVTTAIFTRAADAQTVEIPCIFKDTHEAVSPGYLSIDSSNPMIIALLSSVERLSEGDTGIINQEDTTLNVVIRNIEPEPQNALKNPNPLHPKQAQDPAANQPKHNPTSDAAKRKTPQNKTPKQAS